MLLVRLSLSGLSFLAYNKGQKKLKQFIMETTTINSAIYTKSQRIPIRNHSIVVQQPLDTVIDEFEQEWQTAISGDELVRRVHHHIDQLYAGK
ncbi:hypothetical protein AGMMS4956_21220 [Bacteroidia bacterium]|nr:hypothetical protein AGMMS4956_21220 [Bacteroidia bacterium]